MLPYLEQSFTYTSCKIVCVNLLFLYEGVRINAPYCSARAISYLHSDIVGCILVTQSYSLSASVKKCTPRTNKNSKQGTNILPLGMINSLNGRCFDRLYPPCWSPTRMPLQTLYTNACLWRLQGNLTTGFSVSSYCLYDFNKACFTTWCVRG